MKLTKEMIAEFNRMNQPMLLAWNGECVEFDGTFPNEIRCSAKHEFKPFQEGMVNDRIYIVTEVTRHSGSEGMQRVKFCERKIP